MAIYEVGACLTVYTFLNLTNQYFVTMGEGDLHEISKGKDLNVEKSNFIAKIEISGFKGNLHEVHYNEWAKILSLSEATDFGQSILQFLQRVKCKICYRWVDRVEVPSSNLYWSCRCGKTHFGKITKDESLLENTLEDSSR